MCLLSMGEAVAPGAYGETGKEKQPWLSFAVCRHLGAVWAEIRQICGLPCAQESKPLRIHLLRIVNPSGLGGSHL